MNSPNNYVEDCIEKLRNCFSEKNANKLTEDDTWTLLENLVTDTEINREREDKLQKNLQLCLESDVTNITTKYVALKETCEKYQKETVDLQSQLDNLRCQMEMETETQKNEHLHKMVELEENYKRDITNLQNQIESAKVCHEAKEQKLYNELQLAQASTAIQCDEIESNLKRQLVDANSRLRQSQNVVRNLQMELNNLKNQLTVQHSPSHQKLLSKSDLKYQPLPFTRNNTSGEETEMIDFVEAPTLRNSAPLIFKGTNTPRRKYAVPPLKQYSAADTAISKTKSYQKKRKLYNPADIDYLDDLEENK